ncbi:MAG: hypothetical protein AAGA37_01915 [Actinomycetota bacterium]
MTLSDFLIDSPDVEEVLTALADGICSSTLFGAETRFVSVSRNGVRVRSDGALVAIVHSLDRKPPERGTQIWRRADYLVVTDFSEWSIYEVTEEKPNLVWAADGPETDSALRRFGGLAGIANTKAHAVVSRSFAVEIPRLRRPTLSERLFADDAVRQRVRAGATRNDEQLLDIFSFHERLFDTSGIAQQTVARQSHATQFTLSTQLSPALSFAPEASAANRGDAVTTYGVGAGRGEAREFIVESPSADRDLDEIRYNVAYLLGIRRTKLFRASYAERLYSVVLPAARVNDGAGCLALVPVLSLTRLPGSTQLRRTIGVTLMCFPISHHDDRLVARQIDDRRVDSLASSLRCKPGATGTEEFSAAGPLLEYLRPGRAITSLSGLGTAVLQEVAVRMSDRSDESQRLALRAVERARHHASFGSACVLTTWESEDEEPWRDWASGAADPAFEHLLHRTVFTSDYHSERVPFSSPRSVDFRDLSVGNAHGADLAGLTFYNPQEDVKYVTYPAASEIWPNHSILRWFAWQVYLDVAIASVRSHVATFHERIDVAGDLRRVLRSAQELSNELAEVYDLDLADFFYRREYESLRAIMRIEDDFRYLMDRLDSAQGKASLREQILMNNLILAYTLAGTFAAFAIAFAETEKWEATAYVVGAVVVVAAAVGASFGLLEPLRRLLSRARERRRRSTA